MHVTGRKCKERSLSPVGMQHTGITLTQELSLGTISTTGEYTNTHQEHGTEQLFNTEHTWHHLQYNREWEHYQV